MRGLLAPKAWARRCLSQVLLAPPEKRFIFVYHEVSDLAAPHHSPDYSTTVCAFRAQIDLLARAFTFVSLDEIVSRDAGDDGRRLAAITFETASCP